MNELHSRILSISKQYGLGHIGSCLTSVGIIDEIYKTKQYDELFVLSCGHAGLALYVVIEKYYGIDAEHLFRIHGTHPNIDIENKIYCSTGSLGHGIGIALGMALSDRTKNVYCLISDGECFEGSIWEVAHVIHRYNVTNLKVYLNFNGLSAYHKVEEWMLSDLITIFPTLHVRRTKVEDYGLEGLKAHYIKI
jgi:transketolase